MRNPEHREQAALFKWAKLNEHKRPELALMFAVPNGGHRHLFVAKKLKAEGVKAGVPDILLPVSRGRCSGGYCRSYHGLFIEMKAGRNRPTGAQKQWHERLAKAGYKIAVCYGWQDAARVIEEYLQYGQS